jgi:alpha-beta hydrolase superfamily lysophospholipase
VVILTFTIKRFIRISAYLLVVVFIFMNAVAEFHAYKFTHFAETAEPITRQLEELSTKEKINTLLFGVSLPRPCNTTVPKIPHETIRISNDTLDCWELPVSKSKGTVLVFHGYGNRKSGMLDKAYAMHEMGYRVVLVDLSGCGGSKGNATTIGYYEAKDVKAAYDFYKEKYIKEPIILLGTSMGAAAVMKSMKDYSMDVSAILLECPFGSMYKTVCNRFDDMHVPQFPMSGLLVFYGGLLNGFWAFDHNPIDYVSHIQAPVLLMNGGKDARVSLEEIDDIYSNLKGPKKKVIFPYAGHESYLNDYAKEWKKEVSGFLKEK